MMQNARVMLLSAAFAALFWGCEKSSERVESIAFSPDGGKIAFAFKSSLFLADVDAPGPGTWALEGVALAEPHFSWSPDSRWIAYTASEAGSWDIWLYDLGTRVHSQLTNHLAKDHLATFWPGSGRVLFVSTRGRQPDIWHVGIDACLANPLEQDADCEQLTNDEDAESELSVSFDGRVLVFKSTSPSGEHRIVAHRMPEESSSFLVPPGRALGQLRVAPNGEALAFVGHDGLYVAELSSDAIGQAELVLKRDGSGSMGFDWSPDSGSLLVANRGCIVRKHLGWLGGKKILTKPLSPDTLPVWHPDERRFAYCPGFEDKNLLVATSPVESTETRHWSLATPELAYVAARYERAKDRRDAALALAGMGAGSIKGGGDQAAVHRLHAELLLSAGKIDEALTVYDSKLKGSAEVGAIQLVFNRDLPAAKAAFAAAASEEKTWRHGIIKRAMDELEGPALDIFCRAMAAEYESDFRRAATDWRGLAAAAAKSESLSAWASRAHRRITQLCQEELRDPRAAIKAYRRWLEVQPQHPDAASSAMAIARLLEGQKEYKRAAREYERIASVYPAATKAEALLALASLYQSKLNEPAKALEAAQAARVEAQDAGADARQTLLDAWNQEVDLRLQHERDPKAALAAATRLPKLIGPPSDEALVEAIDRCLRSFDLAYKPELANEALQTLLPLVADADGLHSLVTQQAEHLLRRLSPEPFVKCKLGHLPHWCDARVRIVSEHMDKCLPPDASRPERFALKLIAAWRPGDVDALLKPLEKLRQSGDTSDEVKSKLAMGYYVLGNFHQTQRDMPRALAAYDKLLDVVDDSDFEQYKPVIAECQKLLPRRVDVVRQWLDLERSIAHGLWVPVAFVFSAAEGDGDEPGDGIQWLVRRLREAAPQYEEFLKKRQKTSLADDACFRLIEISPPERKRARAQHFIETYPASRLFGRALGFYVACHRQEHTPWLAAAYLTDLAGNPGYAACVPTLHLAVGELYADDLERFDLGKPHFEEVSRQHPASPEWPNAEKRLIEELLRQKERGHAAPRLQSLIAKCPDFPWVKTGSATLALGQTWEKLGQWPRAEEAYVTVITQHRELDEVKELKLLKRCFSRFSPDALDRIHKAAPDDLRKLMAELDPEQAAKLRARYPRLAEAEKTPAQQP